MRTTIVAAVYLACVCLCGPTRGQSFTGLGDLPGGPFSSSADGLSGNGQFVTGGSQIDGDVQEAFLWSEDTGLVGLGFPPGSDTSRGFAVSNDGGVVVGYHGANLSGTQRALLWTASGGPTDFDPFPPGADLRYAWDVSADGSTIVGDFRLSPGANVAAYHWNGGTLTEIGDPASAGGVSADGAVVVGQTLTAGPTFAFEASIWTEAEGLSGLGFLPGGTRSEADGVSADGQVVVGHSSSTSGNQAFRWTEAGGMVGLGDLPGGDFNSSALDSSADGSVVVGKGNVLGGVSSSSFDPFIWDEAYGMRNLVDVLCNDFGLGDELAGWDLAAATAISDDGTVIVGYGTNPEGNDEAWRAVLVPEPSSALLGAFVCVGLLTFRRRG